jgi:hypothetical protein
MRPLPLLCARYNSLTTVSDDLVSGAFCGAWLPKIASRGINKKLIVLIVSLSGGGNSLIIRVINAFGVIGPYYQIVPLLSSTKLCNHVANYLSKKIVGH